jgi:cell wall-associated NlpC family hydrolase
MAYLHVGINLGRDTFEMLAQGGIYQISWRDRRPGDLLFWGNSHVEFATRHNSFGAQQPGTLVGWHLLWGSPTVWRIR